MSGNLDVEFYLRGGSKIKASIHKSFLWNLTTNVEKVWKGDQPGATVLIIEQPSVNQEIRINAHDVVAFTYDIVGSP